MIVMSILKKLYFRIVFRNVADSVKMVGMFH